MRLEMTESKPFFNVRFFYRTQIACLVSLVLVGVFIISTNAQTAVRPDRGIMPVGSYSVSDIETVNMTNGNMHLAIPLARLAPMAGGKLSAMIPAYYDSKLWDARQVERQDEDDVIYPVSLPQLSPHGGWKIGGWPYTLAAHNLSEDYSFIPVPLDPEYNSLLFDGWHKLMLTGPDGSTHELRPLDYAPYQGGHDYVRGYFKGNNGGQPKRYYSFDGSYIWAKGYPLGSPIAWEIYFPDGTKVVQGPGIQRITDTNGNSIKIYFDSDQSGNITAHYQDEQTGREIRYVDTGATGQVQYQTVGGEWAAVDITFGSTVVQGKVYSVQDANNCDYQEGFAYEVPVVREIVLPQTEPGLPRQKFSFAYSSDTNDSTPVYMRPNCTAPPQLWTNSPSHGWGSLSQMTMPNGATVKYDYSLDGNQVVGISPESIAEQTLVSKTLTHDGVVDTWSYNITGNPNSVIGPDGSVTTENVGAGPGLWGLVIRTNHSDKVVTERHWVRMKFDGAQENCASCEPLTFNPVVDAEYTTLLDDTPSHNPVKMSAKTFQHDYNGNVIQTTEYDWFDPALVSRDAYGVPTGVPGSAVVLRVSNSSYYNPAPSSNSENVYAKRPLSTTTPLIVNALQQTTVGPAITQLSYDGQAYGTAPTLGNLTKVSAWDSVSSQFIHSLTGYDPYGNVITKTDPKGNVTQIFYEDSTHAMPTKTIVDPQNGTGQQIATATYDFYTGLPLTSTDINGNVSSLSYANHLLGTIDPFSRVGTAYGPYVNIDGVNKRQTVKTYYEDNARKTMVESDLFNEGDALLKSRESRDQLGRTILTEKNENGASTYTISSETVYKTQDRVVMKSNPHRSAAAPTDGWTRVTSDTVGRGTEAATFSGAAQPPTTGTNANWTGSVTTAYSANATTVTDQAGKLRRSVTNALGQLIRVDEPNDAGQLGTVDAPLQPTNYTYDVLNNLLTVVQAGNTTAQCGGAASCSQTRSFVYNSLSRLTSATNPESGTISYIYDANGNLTRKTDARNIQTNYTYDALNRVTLRDYSDTTLDVAYTYENISIPYSKGKLTKVTNGTGPNTSTTEYTSFDILGRVTQSKQTTDGVTYGNGTTDSPMTYTYNLGGALVEQQYPSGRMVKNVLETDGDLAVVQSKKNANSGYFNYADSFTYNAAGAVTSMQLGNGRWESTVFNSRLQPTQIALGTVQNGTDKLKLDYSYGGIANNGNVQSQTITVPTVGSNQGFTAVQTYTYDSLNRLKDAKEMIGTTQTWKQTFLYDRYGNRRFDTANTTTITPGCPEAVCNPQINQANNRLISYQFDNSGNTTLDAENRTFIYDAENKQKEVKDINNISIGQYFYDGDGRRVKKFIYNTQETTIFVYDAASKLVAEYSTTVIPSQDAKVAYTTSDHLGSPRINTDQDGNTISRHDYHPFGEEIITSQRTAHPDYAADTIRQKFTGYERDNEINLDFAQARYFSYNHGRFTSPDDFGNDTDVADPQSWNLYIYVRNNPLKYIDPTGEEIWVSFQEEEEYEEDGEKKKRTVTRRVQYRNGALYNQDGSDYTGNNQYALNARDHLNTLSQDRELGRMIGNLAGSRKVHTIMRNPDKPNANGVDKTANGTNVYWSGEDSTYGDENDNRIPTKAIFTLAHELLGHSWFVDRGRERAGGIEGNQRLINGRYAFDYVQNLEIDAVSVENRGRRLLGAKERLHASGADISEYLIHSFLSPRRPPKLKVSPNSRPRQ